jgi:hypothetical protein
MYTPWRLNNENNTHTTRHAEVKKQAKRFAELKLVLKAGVSVR